MNIKKFDQFNKLEKEEIEDIYFDGAWNIILKNYDRVISDEKWTDVKWMFKQMIKKHNFDLQW